MRNGPRQTQGIFTVNHYDYLSCSTLFAKRITSTWASVACTNQKVYVGTLYLESIRGCYEFSIRLNNSAKNFPEYKPLTSKVRRKATISGSWDFKFNYLRTNPIVCS